VFKEGKDTKWRVQADRKAKQPMNEQGWKGCALEKNRGVPPWSGESRPTRKAAARYLPSDKFQSPRSTFEPKVATQQRGGTTMIPDYLVHHKEDSLYERRSRLSTFTQGGGLTEKPVGVQGPVKG